ncbi:MAG: iron ABC transporter permease [Clostridiales bacterium]|nr:iron ABC transporter permease [Clostridiales bacterium]
MDKSGKKTYFARRPGGIALMAALLCCILLLSLRYGSADMSWPAFWDGLLRRPGAETQTAILYLLRLPRLAEGVLAGVGLSVSGVLLQSVTGNELASPNIIGVNAGAGFVVILLLFFCPAAYFFLPFAAFGGAFLTTLLILSIAGRIGSGKTTVILAGIACTAMFNAGISFFSLLDADVLVSYNYFSVGGLSSAPVTNLIIPALLIALGLAVSLMAAPKIRLLCLGDSMAASLGVRVKRLRTLCLILASASAAAVVSFAGLLGFVGLVVPHIARKLAGGHTGYLLLAASLVGSALVLTADWLGRTLFAPSELPVGVVMALVGAPFFFILLLKRRRRG